MIKMNLQLFASSYSKTVTNNAAGEVDKQTQQKYEEYKKGYKESQNVADAYKYLQDTLGKQPGAFDSKYKGQLDNLYSQINGREKFSYDMNADMLYQQYKDQYVRNGEKAMQDTLGQATALTGGYDNSYAQSAAQQTYQGYLAELNDKVPELYQRAYDRYRQEGDDLYQQYSMASDLYGKEYGEYRDTVADWQTDRGYATDRYQSERDFDYNDYQNMLNFYQNEYWNQRHSKSVSETNGVSGTTSGNSSGSGSSGRGSKNRSSKEKTSFDTYEEAAKYMRDEGVTGSDGGLMTKQEWTKRKKAGSKAAETAYESYEEYLNAFVDWRSNNPE